MSATVHIDMQEIMLDVMTTMTCTAPDVGRDAVISYYAPWSDKDHRDRFAASCLENVRLLRDKLNEILAQAEQAAHREAA